MPGQLQISFGGTVKSLLLPGPSWTKKRALLQFLRVGKGQLLRSTPPAAHRNSRKGKESPGIVAESIR